VTGSRLWNISLVYIAGEDQADPFLRCLDYVTRRHVQSLIISQTPVCRFVHMLSVYVQTFAATCTLAMQDL
jgi:hypothetical protein